MSSQATEILSALVAGDRSGADRLMEIVYDDFRQLAKRYLPDDGPTPTLRPTAVVHEAYMRLVRDQDVDWRGRSHFFAVGAVAMRQILVDHARRKGAAKRGKGRQRIALEDSVAISTQSDEDVLAVDEALTRLRSISEVRARIVELRFFGGLTIEEVAEAVGMSRRTVQNQWAATRVWLRRELAEQGGAA